MRESAYVKSRRYLVEGRVILVRVTTSTALAHVRGDGAVHTVIAAPHIWTCTCPARGRCCHQLAVGLVTAIPQQEKS